MGFSSELPSWRTTLANSRPRWQARTACRWEDLRLTLQSISRLGRVVRCNRIDFIKYLVTDDRLREWEKTQEERQNHKRQAEHQNVLLEAPGNDAQS